MSQVVRGRRQGLGAVPPQHSAGEVTGVTKELEESRSQDDVLAGELLLHQGGVRHQVQPLCRRRTFQKFHSARTRPLLRTSPC